MATSPSGSTYTSGTGVVVGSALKKRYRDGVTETEAVRLCVDALYDAADDDSATGGPDTVRRIFTDDSVSEIFAGENQLF